MGEPRFPQKVEKDLVIFCHITIPINNNIQHTIIMSFLLLIALYILYLRAYRRTNPQDVLQKDCIPSIHELLDKTNDTDFWENFVDFPICDSQW